MTTTLTPEESRQIFNHLDNPTPDDAKRDRISRQIFEIYDLVEEVLPVINYGRIAVFQELVNDQGPDKEVIEGAVNALRLAERALKSAKEKLSDFTLE